MATDQPKKSFLSVDDLLKLKPAPRPKPVYRQSWADHEEDLDREQPWGLSESEFLGHTPGDKD